MVRTTVYNRKFGKKRIDKSRKDHPLRVDGDTKRISNDEGDYIIFSGSDENTDSAQTAVPFWDAQPSTPFPAMPLSGIGFIWRSVHNSGGFLAPLVVPYSCELFMHDYNFTNIDLIINDYGSSWNELIKF